MPRFGYIYRRPTLTNFQRRWRYARIRRMQRSYRRTPLRYRMARRVPTWYFRYGRYRRLRY